MPTKENNPANFANNREKAAECGRKGKGKVTSPETKAKKSIGFAVKGGKTITPEVQQAIRDQLTQKERNGHSYLTNFISNFLKEAKNEPNSQAARIIAGVMFKDDLLAKLDETLVRQMNRDISFAVYQIRKTLYDKQQEVFDNDTDKTILIINSRRSGKTELLGRLIVKRLLQPNSHVVYVNRSFEAAQRQIRKPFQTALDAVGGALTITNGSIGGGMVNFDNGSWLLIVGNNNAADVDKIRGESVSLALIDEFGHMRHLRQLVQEVIQPATMDYADSQMVFVGTPPRTKSSFAHELWNNSSTGIKRYHWTFMDNPFIPNKEDVIPKACELNGVSPDSMFIKREYYGDINAYDDDALYIKHYTIEELPKDHTYWQYYVGVDFGYEDKAAVILAVADKVSKKLYVVDDWSEARKGTTEVIGKVREFLDKIPSLPAAALPPIVITDTNEKGASADMATTYHIDNVRLAYKYDKDYALDQLSDWLSAGTVVLSPKAKATIEDAENMIWKRNEDTDVIEHTLDDDAYHGNAMFALLYISRQYAYDVMGLVEQNKPAKEAVTAKDLAIKAGEKPLPVRDEGLLDIGNGAVSRSFVR